MFHLWHTRQDYSSSKIEAIEELKQFMRLHSIQNMQDAITYLYQPQCFPKPDMDLVGVMEEPSIISAENVLPSEFVDI